MLYSWNTNLALVEFGPFLIPDIAWTYFFNRSRCDKFFKEFSGIRKHFLFKFAYISQKTLTVKCLYAQFMKHKMIHRGIGKAKEWFPVHNIFKPVIFKQIWKQAKRIISANGTKDHIHFRIGICFDQVRSSVLRMLFYIIDSFKSMFRKLYRKPHCLQPFNTDLKFMCRQ